ncbi:hypothetical protein [Limosilactobacillus vaginalis]|uniref:hypothetical protein n=1 Tax=Limosilactobacillus vaginalis TaxID=1633 RepID=UPI00361D41A1
MADLTKIFSGMQSGPEDIWSNFEKINQDLENIGGTVDGLTWSAQSRDGLVAQNGWRIMGGGYSYARVGNKKLVVMDLFMSNDNNGFKGNATNTAVSMPPEFSIPNNYQGEARPDINWMVVNSNVSFSRRDGGVVWDSGSGSMYTVHAMYVK